MTFKATRPAAGMGYDAALELLQLRPTYDVSTIKAAFARRCRESHPDTFDAGGDPTVTIDALQAARDVLLQAALGMNRACKLCRGVGQVRGSVGWRRCGACKGTGDN